MATNRLVGAQHLPDMTAKRTFGTQPPVFGQQAVCLGQWSEGFFAFGYGETFWIHCEHLRSRPVDIFQGPWEMVIANSHLGRSA